MNAIFHKGYFKEVFRQLRVAGLVSAAILALLTLTRWLNDGVTTVMPSASNMARLPMIYAYIMGFVLTLTAYRWLNKRSQSDFYHSIPVSRKAMYFSTFAAIMLWMVIGIGVSAVINLVFNLALGCPFNYLLYLCVLINVFIASIAIVSAVSIACALSGTDFVRFVAALVILFMPRVLLSILGAFVMLVGSETLVLGNISILFDPTFNIAGTYPYAALMGQYGAAHAAIDFANVWAMLYSFAYAVLLLFLGCRAFVTRKSEDAGTPTSSKVLQTVIGCAFGMPLLFILVAMINGGMSVYSAVISGFFLLLFSFVAYCLYHLISTKSLKKMCRAMPLYLICIAVAALFIVLPRLIAKAELGIKVEESDVKSVSLNMDDSGYYYLLDSMLNNETREYKDLLEKKIEYSDERSIAIITKALRSERYSEYGADQDLMYGARVTVDRKGGKDLVRDVSFTEREWEELMRIMESNNEFKAAQTAYPEGHLYYIVNDLDSVSAKLLGKQFEEEFASLTPEQIEGISGGSGYSSLESIEFLGDIIEQFAQFEELSLGSLRICGCKGVENYVNDYKLTDLTPKTAKLYIKLVNDKYFDKSMDKIDSIIDRLDEDAGDMSFYSGYFNVSAAHPESGKLLNVNSWNADGELRGMIKELLELYRGAERCDELEGCVRVSVSDNNGTGKSFIKLSPENEARAELLIDSINKQLEIRNGNYWGSFTDELIYSYDEKYFALYEYMGASVLVHVCDGETGEDVDAFSPARTSDFYGICWEPDSYNIWIQSGDIGIKCYRYEDGTWTLDEDAVMPDSIYPMG